MIADVIDLTSEEETPTEEQLKERYQTENVIEALRTDLSQLMLARGGLKLKVPVHREAYKEYEKSLASYNNMAVYAYEKIRRHAYAASSETEKLEHTSWFWNLTDNVRVPDIRTYLDQANTTIKELWVDITELEVVYSDDEM
jgi:hypothetical protein